MLNMLFELVSVNRHIEQRHRTRTFLLHLRPMLSLLFRPYLSGPLVGRSSRRFAGVSVSVIKEKLVKGLETEVVSVQDTSGGACSIRLPPEILCHAFSSKYLWPPLDFLARLRRFFHSHSRIFKIRGQINGTYWHSRPLTTLSQCIFTLNA